MENKQVRSAYVAMSGWVGGEYAYVAVSGGEHMGCPQMMGLPQLP